MAWEPAPNAEQFLLGLFKKHPDQKVAAERFLAGLEAKIRAYGGKVCVRSDQVALWDVMDGKDHNIEPNHLDPAVFDFDTVLVASFKDLEAVHSWWSSDQVFEQMKHRACLTKMSLHTVDGLVAGFEGTKQRAAMGDKLMLLEISKVEAFRPMQRYVDMYKHLAIKAHKDIGTVCNLLFAEGISGVLMNDFPVQAVCASCWRTRSDVISWYEAPNYQQDLMPLRYDFARCYTVAVPMWEDRKVVGDKGRRASAAAGLKLRSLEI
mmetsp:Transcript_43478/g.101557  ORF Transcript_43478/g.101557 Transcript_43478/m.101557 type:complete len:264 (+) Transcript_43478:108-899(+)